MVDDDELARHIERAENGVPPVDGERLDELEATLHDLERTIHALRQELADGGEPTGMDDEALASLIDRLDDVEGRLSAIQDGLD